MNSNKFLKWSTIAIGTIILIALVISLVSGGWG